MRWESASSAVAVRRRAQPGAEFGMGVGLGVSMATGLQAPHTSIPSLDKDSDDTHAYFMYTCHKSGRRETMSEERLKIQKDPRHCQ